MDDLRRRLKQIAKGEKISGDDVRRAREQMENRPFYRNRLLQGSLFAILAGVSVAPAVLPESRYTNTIPQPELEKTVYHQNIERPISDKQLYGLRELGFTPYLAEANILAQKMKTDDDPKLREQFRKVIGTLEIAEQHQRVMAEKYGVAGIVRSSIEAHYKNPAFKD